MIPHIFYRGSLKSCNYACSYCPFSKRKGTDREIKRDQEEWERFVTYIEESGFSGTIQIIPYGEALRFPYYWQGMARLTKLPGIQAVGAQSNFSFNVEQMIELFQQAGGQVEKLRLWGTFHPEMTDKSRFTDQCRELMARSVLFCAGAVGVPENLELLQELRSELPEEIYLWINRMDGMKRAYTDQERKEFLKIDPWFELEEHLYRTEEISCEQMCLVDGRGSIYDCNLSRERRGNLYEEGLMLPMEKQCRHKYCSCYLNYCHARTPDFLSFGATPSFRIPQRKKALFLDLDGTILRKNEKKIAVQVERWLERQAKWSALYVVTARPYESALKVLGNGSKYITGGVYGLGGRVQIAGVWDKSYPVNWQVPEALRAQSCIRITYGTRNGEAYKIAIQCKNKRKQTELRQQVEHQMREQGQEFELVVEDEFIELTAKGRTKLQGIQEICQEAEYEKEEIMVFGNSRTDLPYLMEYPDSVAGYESVPEVRSCCSRCL